MDNTTAINPLVPVQNPQASGIAGAYDTFSNQVAALAHTQGPAALHYVTEFARMTALTHVIGYTVSFAFLFVLTLIFGLWANRTLKLDDDNPIPFIALFMLTVASIFWIVGFCVSGVWDVVGLYHPDIYAGKLLLDAVSNRR